MSTYGESVPVYMADPQYELQGKGEMKSAVERERVILN